MFNFKIFEFGDELHGGSYHTLLKKILKKHYKSTWIESITDIDKKNQNKSLNYHNREKSLYQLYKNNNIYKWDFCSESKWSKIGVIIPELFFLDSKKDMSLFLDKYKFPYHPLTIILDKDKHSLDRIKTELINKIVYVKDPGYSVFKAERISGNHSGNLVRVYNNLSDIDINNEILSNNYDSLVFQKTVDDMMLFQNRKFDVRFHVLFILYKGELLIYSHEYNFCRTTVNEYNSHSKNKSNFITNYNFQEKKEGFSPEKCQIMFNNLPNYNTIHENIKKQIIKLGEIIIEDINFTCFKPKIWFVGFDFIIDKKLKPWIIEINHNPGFITPYPKEKYNKINIAGVKSLIDYFLTPILKNTEIKKKRMGVFNYLFSSPVKNK